jgi:hypothetical protein
MISKKKKYHLSLIEKLKVPEVRKNNPKTTEVIIIKLFYEETQRSITDSTLRRIIKNEENIIASEGNNAELIEVRPPFSD